MTYKGNNFKKMLELILTQRHKQPIKVGDYFIDSINSKVSVDYEYKNRGKSIGHTTSICQLQIIEFQMNYIF